MNETKKQNQSGTGNGDGSAVWDNITSVENLADTIHDIESADRDYLDAINDDFMKRGIVFKGGKQRNKIYNEGICRISTLVCGGSVNTIINNTALFKAIDDVLATQKHVISVKYGKNKKTPILKGDGNLETQKDMLFGNQITMKMMVKGKEMTLMIFKNGSINITGVNYIEYAPYAFEYLIRILNEVHTKNEASGAVSAEDRKEFEEYREAFRTKKQLPMPKEEPMKKGRKKKLVDPNLYEERLKEFQKHFQGSSIILEREPSFSLFKVNSVKCDFKFNCEFRISELYRFLHRETDLKVIIKNERPTIEIKFYSNETGDGVCRCQPKCMDFMYNDAETGQQKKMQRKNYNCIQITSLIFSSGSANIAGAKTIRQASDAFKYLVELIWEHRENYIKYSLPDLTKL